MRIAFWFALIACAWPAWAEDSGAAGAGRSAAPPDARRSAASNASEHHHFLKIERRANTPARAVGTGKPAKDEKSSQSASAVTAAGGRPKHDTVKNSISNIR